MRIVRATVQTVDLAGKSCTLKTAFDTNPFVACWTNSPPAVGDDVIVLWENAGPLVLGVRKETAITQFLGHATEVPDSAGERIESSTWVTFGTISLDVTKRWADTSLLCDLRVAFQQSDSSSTVATGVMINSTAYETYRARPGHTYRYFMSSGLVVVSGLSAGTVTVEPAWARLSGSGYGELTERTRVNLAVWEVL